MLRGQDQTGHSSVSIAYVHHVTRSWAGRNRRLHLTEGKRLRRTTERKNPPEPKHAPRMLWSGATGCRKTTADRFWASKRTQNSTSSRQNQRFLDLFISLMIHAAIVCNSSGKIFTRKEGGSRLHLFPSNKTRPHVKMAMDLRGPREDEGHKMELNTNPGLCTYKSKQESDRGSGIEAENSHRACRTLLYHNKARRLELSRNI